jgi:hypothetical protein
VSRGADQAIGHGLGIGSLSLSHPCRRIRKANPTTDERQCGDDGPVAA